MARPRVPDFDVRWLPLDLSVLERERLAGEPLSRRRGAQRAHRPPVDGQSQRVAARPGWAQRRRAALLAMAGLLALAGCRCGKSDAQRAREEREAVQQRLSRSLVLWPYPLLKVAVRSAHDPARPAAIDALAGVVAQTAALPQQPRTSQELAATAAVYARLAGALYAARASLGAHDEDDYPTAYQALWGAPPAVAGLAYDAPLEHLLLAALWFLADQAGSQVPASAELLLYEVSRAAPQPRWDPALTALAQLMRGLAFCSADAHYAAEEELTEYLTRLEGPQPPLLFDAPGTAGQGLHQAQAAGYLARAWNRHALGRSAGMEEDLAKGLDALEAAGIDDELTDWVRAVLHTRRADWPAAAKALEQLAGRPSMDAQAAQRLRAAAQQARAGSDGFSPLLQAQVAAQVLSALGARAVQPGGLLTVALGEARAKELEGKAQWLVRLRQALPAVDPKGLAEGAKGLGQKGVGWVKEQLGARDGG